MLCVFRRRCSRRGLDFSWQSRRRMTWGWSGEILSAGSSAGSASEMVFIQLGG
jgi:hypothetical protein